MSDVTTNNETAIADTMPNTKRGHRRFILLIVLPCIAAIVVGIVYLKSGRYMETENAYVKANKIAVSAKVSGQIVDVLVHENQSVKAGQLLFRIDPAAFEVLVAKAEASLAQVRINLSVLKDSYQVKEAEIALARTNFVFARHDQRRKSSLAASKFISAATFDNAQQATDIARQNISVLQKSLAQIVATLGGNIDAPIENHPDYRIAKAQLDEAKLMLARTDIRAAQAGIVSKLPRVGQYVGAGATALMLVVSNNYWIEANYTEKDLTYVHPGQAVKIHIDTYPDTVWIKIAQRLAVRISIQPTPAMPKLRAGLSSDVEIDTKHQRSIFGLTL